MADYCKILIIDDEFILRQGIRHMLDWERQGFEIIGEAANGKEGLELIAQVRPHIVLCDIVMPQMDGVEFSKIAKRLYPEIQIIILSSYDNFEYVKGALQSGVADYVLKPTLNPQGLLEVLKCTAARIPGMILSGGEGISLEKSLERYLTGNEEHLSGPEITAHFPYTFYRVFGVLIRHRDSEGRDISAVLYDKIIESMKQCSHCSSIVTVIREEIVCIVLNFRAGERQQVIDYMAGMMERLALIYKRIYGVLSEEFSTRSQLKKIFDKMVMPELDKGFYHSNTHLQINAEPQERILQPKFDFNRFTRYLEEWRYHDALQDLTGYIEKALKAQLEEFRLKNQLQNVLYSFIDMIKISREKKEELQYKFFKQVEMAGDEEELRAVTRKIHTKLCETLDIGIKQEDYRIRQILHYISQNYSQELDLAAIAEVFNFNYYYLSAYFSRHMGEGFSEYLNRIRIEQACRILREQDVSIAQVSDEVGYSDSSYFCRVFKKVTGDTPSAWRRSHRKRG